LSTKKGKKEKKKDNVDGPKVDVTEDNSASVEYVTAVKTRNDL
jgi:hypothetical protein